MPEGPEKRTDEELVAAVLAGDVDCFEPLVVKYQSRIFGMARRYVRGESDVEDLVQDILAKAFQKLSSFKAKAPFEHWLMRLAVRTCYDAYRRRKRNREQIVTDTLHEEEDWFERLNRLAVEDPDPGPELREVVHKVLDLLQPKHRMVLTLQELEGRSIKEISELTGWSISNVKVQAFRARKEMRKCLERLMKRQLV